MAGIPGSLADRPRYQSTFYAVIVMITAAGVAMSIVHVNVIQALVIASALSGVAAVPLLVLMTLFGADSKYMSKRRSGRLSQALTWIAVGAMSAACLALLGSFVFR